MQRGVERAVTATAMALLVSCGGGGAASIEDATWRGTVTTHENVTTVINESGSVWESPARLVERASIGVLEGAEELMLGQIGSVVFDGDRILIADLQVPAVRIFSRDGGYLGDLSRAGQGPGEYEHPASIAIADDGRIFVRDDRGRRILVYSADGEYRETLPLAGGLQTGTQMIVTPDGIPYTIVIAERLPDDPFRLWRLGMQAHGADGPYGDPIVAPSYDYERGVIQAERSGGRSMSNVPFWPSTSSLVTRELATVSGVSTDYRIEVRRPAGSILVFEHRWDPVAVDPGEADWFRRRATAQMRTMADDWVWNGPEVPATKPAFQRLLAAHSGEVWVQRAGAGIPVEPCNVDAEELDEFAAAPCWTEESAFDVFGADGRFHGTLETPTGMVFFPTPFIDGDTLVAVIEDDAGTRRVKRYEIVRDGPR